MAMGRVRSFLRAARYFRINLARRRAGTRKREEFVCSESRGDGKGKIEQRAEGPSHGFTRVYKL